MLACFALLGSFAISEIMIVYLFVLQDQCAVMDCASPRPTRKTKTAAAHGTCHVIKDSNVGRILTAWTCKFAATAPGVTLLFVSTGPCHVHTVSTHLQRCQLGFANNIHQLCQCMRNINLQIALYLSSQLVHSCVCLSAKPQSVCTSS
jgi:hypothetical protein